MLLRKPIILENQITKPINIQLPGGVKQFEHLLDQDIQHGDCALIIGTQCESIATALLNYFTNVYIIVNDYDSLMQSRMKLKNGSKIKIKMMDYAHTDFEDGYIDLIYSQGSISVPERKEISKELKRILKDQGLLCVGEIVSLREPVPEFVNDIWERSGLEPVASSKINHFFESNGFKLINEKDLSATLKDFYEKTRDAFSNAGKDEKELNKKYFSRMKHESNVYLKLGGNKFIGFKSLIMRKSN